MIKDEIKEKARDLKTLRIEYAQLIEGIKKECYHKDFFDDNAKLKPRGDNDKMIAAYFYAQQKIPRIFDDARIEQVYSYNPRGEDKDKYEFYQYWSCYPRNNEYTNKPVYILHKKNIKLLESMCKDLWKQAINARFEPSTELGFEDWMKTVEVDTILELITESECDLHYEIITERKLYLKDILIIYPSEPRKNRF